MRRPPLSVAVAAAALALAAPAFAYVCHPALPGTRSAWISGRVLGYSMAGGRVSIAVARHGSCGAVAWVPGRRAVGEAGSCAAILAPHAAEVHGWTISVRGRHALRWAGATRPAAVALDERRVAVATTGSARGDLPPTLSIYDRKSGGLVQSWPLPVRPTSLDVDGDLAAFAGAGAAGFFVIRLTDGKVMLVGPNQARDFPQVEHPGVVFQDDLMKREDGRGRVLMKFVPRGILEKRLNVVGAPLRVNGPIRAFAMDGSRVAVAVGGSNGCDRVLFWNIPWMSVQRLTDNRGPTCGPGTSSGRITALGLAGSRAEWVTRNAKAETVLAASIIACQEWVVRRLASGLGGDRVTGIAGAGDVLAFALERHERELRGQASLGVVTRGFRGLDIATGPSAAAAALSVDSGRVASLRSNGTVDVRTRRGTLVRRFRVGDAAAIALRGPRLAVLRHGALDVYGVATGRLLRRLAAPVGTASAVDIHFGIAVVTAGPAVYALDLATGHRALVATAPSRARAHIEAPGIAYAYRDGRGGVIAFVPMARVQALLR